MKQAGKQEIRLEEQGKEVLSSRLFKCITASLFCAAFLFYFLSVTSAWSVFFICSVGAVIISALMQLISLEEKRKNKLIAFGGVTTGILILALILKKHIENGGISYINGVISNWNLKNGTIHYLFVTNNANIDLDLLLFSFFIMAVISIIINVCIRTEHAEFLILIQYTSFILYMMASIKPNPAVILLSSALIIIYLAFDRVEAGIIRQSRVFWIVTAASVLILSGMSYALCRKIPEERLSAYREDSIKYIEKKIYGQADLPEGNLPEIEPRNLNSEQRLKVTAEKAGLVYLKGYVGCRFENNRWTELDKEAYSGENENMLKYMNENEESPLLMLSKFISLSNEYFAGTYKYEPEVLKVENTGASDKYLYVPYSSSGSTFNYGDNIYKDQNLRNPMNGITEDYVYSVGNVDVNELISLYDNGILQKIQWDASSEESFADDETAENVAYFNLEQAYRNYVNEYYMEVPEDIEEFLNNNLEALDTEIGVEYITDYIREYLRDYAVYNDKPEWAYSDTLIIDFLEGKAGGYSVYYATAATLMYRHYGVPARYAEGYRCELTAGENRITAANASAWVEVYRYGMGWVPIEVTPGLYFDENIVEEQQTVAEMPEVTPPPVTEEKQPEIQEELPEEEIQENPGLIKIILLVIFILLAIILVFVLRIIIVRRKVKLRINSEDLSDAVLYMAGRMWPVIKKAGIDVDKGMPIKSEAEIDELYQVPTGTKYGVIDEILMRAKYSCTKIAQEDYDKVRAYYDVLMKYKAEKNTELTPKT